MRCSPSTTGPAGAKSACVAYLAQHRDMYRYLHDQTLRLANRGLTPTEIAARGEAAAEPRAQLVVPRLLRHCLAQRARRLPALLGLLRRQPRAPRPAADGGAGKALRASWRAGSSALLDHAREALAEGDYRWAAELCSHAVFAEPRGQRGAGAERPALEQLGYQSESAVWRNLYLVGAHELRNGPPPAHAGGGGKRRRGAGAVDRTAVGRDGHAPGRSARMGRADRDRLGVHRVGEQLDGARAERRAVGASGARRDDVQATVTLTRSAFDAILLGEGEARSCSRGRDRGARGTAPSSASCSGCWTTATRRSRSSRRRGLAAVGRRYGKLRLRDDSASPPERCSEALNRRSARPCRRRAARRSRGTRRRPGRVRSMPQLSACTCPASIIWAMASPIAALRSGCPSRMRPSRRRLPRCCAAAGG